MALPRLSFARLLATAATALALLLLAGVLALWAASYSSSGGVEWIAHGPGGEFHLLSRDGRLLVGTFTERPGPPWWSWGRKPVSPSLRELVNNDHLLAAGDLFGWGVALPHWLIALLLAVVPAWWLMVHRDQSEQVRRRQFGLCRHCGYDLSHSEGRCPECGALMAPRVFRTAAAGRNGDSASATTTATTTPHPRTA